MKTAESLARNTFYSAASTASNVMLLALVIAAGRILGDADYGKFSLALAVVSIFEIFTDFGLGTLAVKNVARAGELGRTYLHATLPWKIVLSVLAMLALIPAAHLLTQSADARLVIYVLGFAIILRSFKATAHSFYRAYERFDLILLTTYTERILIVAVCGLVLFKTRALVPFAFAFALARIPDLALSYWLLHRKIVPLGFDPSPQVIKSLQIQALPFGSLNVVTIMYAYIGTVILGALRTPAEVGWYSAGYRIYEGLTMFPFILSMVLLPRLSYLFTVDRGRHADLTARALKYLLILSLPIFTCGWLLSEEIVRGIFGADYIPGAPALRMLFAASIFMFANLTLNTVLISADREKLVLRVTSAGLLIMAVSNLVFIRHFGIIGAAYAVITSELCVFALLTGVVRRALFRISAYTIAWRPTLACIVAVGAFYLMRMPDTAASMLLFACVYVAGLFLLRTFDAWEWSAIRNLLKRTAFRP